MRIRVPTISTTVSNSTPRRTLFALSGHAIARTISFITRSLREILTTIEGPIFCRCHWGHGAQIVAPRGLLKDAPAVREHVVPAELMKSPKCANLVGCLKSSAHAQLANTKISESR